MKRTRSYQDLSADEKKRYDRLRRIERRLKDPGGVRAKRCGSRRDRYAKIRDLADAMLGITHHREDNGYIVPVKDEKEKPWTGTTTRFISGELPKS